MKKFKRMILMVLDSAGIGEMPDAADWGDAGADTLGHVLAAEKPRLPNLEKLGLGNIRALPNLPPSPEPAGSFGKAAISSRGKDTTVGHWELAGLITPEPFPTYPEGFPSHILEPFKKLHRAGCAGKQAGLGHGNHPGAGRGTYADGEADRIHLG